VAEERLLIRKVISGGQTGADRGGLDAALTSGVKHGGWCPRGRRAEDGVIPSRYELTETDTSAYVVRSRMNVCDARATLVFTYGEPMGGSLTTLKLCEKEKKPGLHCDLASQSTKQAERYISEWLTRHAMLNAPVLPGLERESSGISLNVAGSRESMAPGIQDRVFAVVKSILERFGLCRTSVR